METYEMTEEEWNLIKKNLSRLYEYQLLIPGALEHEAQGNPYRRELLEEMIEKIQKPEDLNDAIVYELGKISVTLTGIQTRHIMRRNTRCCKE